MNKDKDKDDKVEGKDTRQEKDDEREKEKMNKTQKKKQIKDREMIVRELDLSNVDKQLGRSLLF